MSDTTITQHSTTNTVTLHTTDDTADTVTSDMITTTDDTADMVTTTDDTTDTADMLTTTDDSSDTSDMITSASTSNMSQTGVTTDPSTTDTSTTDLLTTDQTLANTPAPNTLQFVLSLEVAGGVVVGMVIVTVTLVIVVMVQCCVIARYRREKRQHFTQNSKSAEISLNSIHDRHTPEISLTAADYEIADRQDYSEQQQYATIDSSTIQPRNSERFLLQKNSSYGKVLLPRPSTKWETEKMAQT